MFIFVSHAMWQVIQKGAFRLLLSLLHELLRWLSASVRWHQSANYSSHIPGSEVNVNLLKTPILTDVRINVVEAKFRINGSNNCSTFTFLAAFWFKFKHYTLPLCVHIILIIKKVEWRAHIDQTWCSILSNYFSINNSICCALALLPQPLNILGGVLWLSSAHG